MNIFVLNGPNLNMLGSRDPDQYGLRTLKQIESWLVESFPDHNFTFFQSNLEGELIQKIQLLTEKTHDGLIANFGGYTHTSVAIRDALELLEIPIVEVHLSNIHAREEFRHTSLTGSVANGIIAGFGKNSYALGVHAVEQLVQS